MKTRRARTWMTVWVVAVTVSAAAVESRAEEPVKVAPRAIHEITAGDTVYGTIRNRNEPHGIAVFLPRGAKFRATRKPTRGSFLSRLTGWVVPPGSYGPGGWRYVTAATVFAPGYTYIRTRMPGLNPVSIVAKAKQSGVHHLVHWGIQSAGSYRLRTRVTPARKVVVRGRPSEVDSPRDVFFGAYPGYDVSVKLTWRGGTAAIAEFTAPSGQEMTSAVPPKTRGKSIRLRGFTTTEAGDHRIALDLDENVKSWKVQVQLRGRPPEGSTIDARLTGGGSLGGWNDPSLLEFDEHCGIMRAVLRDTDGAPNALCFELQESGAFEVGLDTHRGARESETLDLPDDPSGWARTVVLPRHGEILVHTLTLDAAGRPFAFVAEIDSPLVGSGRVVVSDIVYESQEAAAPRTSWTEVRTFSATGESHSLTFRETRVTGGITLSWVRYNDPAGGVHDIPLLWRH